LHGAIALVFTAILILVLVKPFSPHPPHAQAGTAGSGQNAVGGWQKADRCRFRKILEAF